MAKEEFKCDWCNKPIMRSRMHQGKEIKHHFCNRSCKGEWQKKQREDLGYTKEWLYEQYIVKGRTANDIAKEIGRDPKRVWEWMRDYGIETRKRGYGNTDVYLKPGHTMNRGRHLSEEHREKIRQARLRDGHVPYLVNGEHWLKQEGKHPASWKGGVTPERQTLYFSEKWKYAVKEVWKRDNATCRRCGKHQSNDKNTFHIHHLYPFAEYKRLRANPDNLVLLCPDCHRFVHSSKNTNREFMLKEMIIPSWLKKGAVNG